MPTYEYACTSCGNRFERRQRIIEDPLTDCPQCDGRVRRVMFPVGLVFKGSGFYVTDNRKSGPSGNGDKAAASGSEESKPETKPETKTEVKAEAKSEASTEKEGVAAASGS